MFSSNIIQTFADGNILQTVVIAILLGVAILRMKNPEHKEKAIKGMNVLNDMVFSLINMIMLVSPIGVFFLMGDSFGKYGAGIFTSMATLVGHLLSGLPGACGTGLLHSYLGDRRNQSS